jgi:hypothetical protein
LIFWDYSSIGEEEKKGELKKTKKEEKSDSKKNKQQAQSMVSIELLPFA